MICTPVISTETVFLLMLVAFLIHLALKMLCKARVGVLPICFVIMALHM